MEFWHIFPFGPCELCVKIMMIKKRRKWGQKPPQNPDESGYELCYCEEKKRKEKNDDRVVNWHD